MTIAGFPKGMITRKCCNFYSDFVVLAETVDGVTQMLDVAGVETLRQLEGFLVIALFILLDYVELISLTDLNSHSVQGFEKTPARLLTCVFR